MSVVTETIEVDDGHPFVFSAGPWFQLSMDGLFNNTVSYSHLARDMKVVHFVGTSITVLGGLQPYDGTPNNPPLSSYSIDNEPATTYSAPSPPSYTTVTYYTSAPLSIGEHVLTIKNAIGNNKMLLDAYIIKASGGTPKILQSDGSPVPSSGPVFEGSATSTPNTTLVSSSPSNSVSGPSTGPKTTLVSSQQGTNVTVASINSLITGVSSPPTSTGVSAPPTSTVVPPVIPVSAHNGRKIIVSATCSILFVVAVVAIVFLTRWNKRRQRIHSDSNPRPWPPAPFTSEIEYSHTSTALVMRGPAIQHKCPTAQVSVVSTGNNRYSGSEQMGPATRVYDERQSSNLSLPPSYHES